MVAGVLFVFSNTAAAWASIRFVRRLLAEEDGLTQCVASLIVFLAIAVAALHGASWVSLSPVLVSLLVGLLLGATWWLPALPELPDPAHESWDAERIAGVASLVALGSVAGVWGYLTLVQGTGFDWDDLSYHAASPAWWLRHGTLGTPPLTYQVYFPFNAELISLWFMLPTHTDAFANLGVGIWFALTVSSSLLIARHLDHGRFLPAIVLVCFAISPPVLYLTSTFSANDLALAGLCMAALALAWPPEGASESRLLRRAVVCGIAAGLALGTKVPAAPMVLLLGLWWIGASPRKRWKLVAAYAAAVVLFGSNWYLSNLIDTGNPLFPAEFGPFAGPMDRAAQRQTSLMPAIVAGWTEPSFWLAYFKARAAWPVPVGVVSGLGYVSVLVALAMPGESRNIKLYRALLLTVGLVFLLLFPMQPFSGTANRPHAGPYNLVRYLTLPFALGLTLYGSAARGRPVVQAVLALGPVAAVVWVLARLGLSAPHVSNVSLWTGVGAICAALAVAAAQFRPKVLRNSLVLPAGALLALTVLAVATPVRERQATEHLQSLGGERPIDQLWAQLENLPVDARVGVFSNLPSSHTHYYPLFGREFQLEPVALYSDGKRRKRLHKNWRQEPTGWWWEWEAMRQGTPGPELVANLRAARVEFLVVTRWTKQPQVPWPVQQKAVRQALDADRLLFSDGYSELWDLRP